MIKNEKTKSKKLVPINEANDTVLIRKANELVEAKYKFDIWETRIFLKMLTMIKSTDTGFKEYTIYIGEFIKDFQLTTNKQVYQLIKDAAEKMMKKVIKTKLMTEEDGLMDFMSPLVTGFKGKDEVEGSYIKLSFHPDMKPLLLELSRRYLTYDFRNVANLSSPYHVRLYEILKQYERFGQRRLSVTDFKDLLGIGDEDYKLYGHLKSDVILRAQQRLKENTDISFEFEEVKRGRKVTEIIFKIYPNRRKRVSVDVVTEAAAPYQALNIIPLVEEIPVSEPLFEKYYPIVGEYWGVSSVEFKKRVQQKTEEEILMAIAFTKEAIRNGIVKNPAGLFVEALTKGLKTKEQIQKEASEMKRQKEAEKKIVIDNLTKELEDFEEKYIKDVNEAIREITKDDPTIAEKAIERIKENQKLLGERITDKTIEDFRQNEFLRGLVKREIMAAYPEIFDPIMTEFDATTKELREKITHLKKG
jgi:plasmid replication initiation protein